MRKFMFTLLLSPLFVFLTPSPVLAEPADSVEVESLRNQVQSLQRTVQELQRTINNLQTDTSTREAEVQRQLQEVRRQQAEALPAQPAESPLDLALEELDLEEERRPVSGEIWSREVGRSRLRLLDISFDTLFYGGGSTEEDESILDIQFGAHDPRKRGFTLAQTELSLIGAVDPYFTGEAHLIFSLDPVEGETVTELEEVFLTTQALPYGLQLELGHFFTEFGQINPLHPHERDWIDMPVINSRLFGGDGMRAPGFRLGWLLPTPWFSELHLGMQNADGGQMASFLGGRHRHEGEAEHGHEEEAEHGHEEEAEHGHEEEAELEHEEEFEIENGGIGGRPLVERDVRNLEDFVYLARWNNSWDLTNNLTTVIGFSGLYGPNATGPDADTFIYGLDMKWRWRPTTNFRGWPFLLWQTEVMRRDYSAGRFTLLNENDPDETLTLPGRTLHDWGLYTQWLYGFQYRWATGIRYEYASGNGQSMGGIQNDPFRDDRHRISPLLVWQPSEFSRIRLQYNFDHAKHITGNDAHSVWLGFEWLYGAHPAHKY